MTKFLRQFEIRSILIIFIILVDKQFPFIDISRGKVVPIYTALVTTINLIIVVRLYEFTLLENCCVAMCRLVSSRCLSARRRVNGFRV